MEFRLPELGEGVIEAELVAWLVQPGEQVARGQKLLEVITDKASLDIPSPFAGVISELHGELGQTIKVGDVVLTYTAGSEADEGTNDSNSSRHTPCAVADGTRSVPATMSDQRTVEQSSARQNGNGVANAVNAPATLVSSPTAPKSEPAIAAAPAVRQMARSLNVDLSQVQGSGPGGRVLIDDLLQHSQAGKATEKKPAADARLDLGLPGTRIKLLGLRRKIAEHMVLAKRTIPHYTYVDECEVTELFKLRKSLRDNLARAGEKTTTLAFYVKAAVAALQDVPIVNASLDEEAGEIVLHDKYHIGIATATPRGLLVPVIHDADKMGLIEIGHEIERLTNAARDGSIGLNDLRGGTFTITAIGSIGGLITTPVINHPEAAILGIGKVVKRPVYDALGHLRPADIIYLCISLDHRVVDGAVGAFFGNAICRRLQNPATLLMPDPHL